MFDWEDLGEKTLSKIATVAISSVIKDAKELDVQVKTNPNLLAKGTLEFLIIEAKEIQVTSSLLVDEMRIVLQKIEVNPFKALMGNIQLNAPSQGISHFSISEKNLLQFLIDYPWADSITKYEVISHYLSLSNLGQIYLKLELLVAKENQIKQLELLIEPNITAQAEIQLEIVDCTQRDEFRQGISDLLLKQLLSIFNLTELVIEGLSFKTHQIIIRAGWLILEAKTQLTHFPSTR